MPAIVANLEGIVINTASEKYRTAKEAAEDLGVDYRWFLGYLAGSEAQVARAGKTLIITSEIYAKAEARIEADRDEADRKATKRKSTKKVLA